MDFIYAVFIDKDNKAAINRFKVRNEDDKFIYYDVPDHDDVSRVKKEDVHERFTESALSLVDCGYYYNFFKELGAYCEKTLFALEKKYSEVNKETNLGKTDSLEFMDAFNRPE